LRGPRLARQQDIEARQQSAAESRAAIRDALMFDRQKKIDAQGEESHILNMQSLRARIAQDEAANPLRLEELRGDVGRKRMQDIGAGITYPELPGPLSMESLRARSPEQDVWQRGEDSRAEAKRRASLVDLSTLLKVGGAGTSRDASTGWHKTDDGTWFSRRKDGNTEVFDPKSNTRTVFDAKGNPVEGAAQPLKPGAVVGDVTAQGTGSDGSVAFPTPDPVTNGFWTTRQSGRVDGIHTLGDLGSFLTGQSLNHGEPVSQVPTPNDLAAQMRGRMLAMPDPTARRAALAELRATQPAVYDALYQMEHR
jgi:hypothetical protein